MPIQVMNTGLGGLFSSRINMNLREKNGYSYGASSSFVFRRGAGPFLIGTGVRTDATAPAVKEIFNELALMRTTRMTDDELRIAKDSFARSLPGLFETTPDAAASVGQLFVYDLPLDYYSALPKKIDAVTGEEIERVAAKYLTPEKMVIIAVGDRSKIEPELEKIKLGAIELRGLDGKISTSK
ncbi:MAG: insulinase family protein [Pyrinomonadaceae bacterium]